MSCFLGIKKESGSWAGKMMQKIAEMTTKYLEHYIILVYKAATEI